MHESKTKRGGRSASLGFLPFVSGAATGARSRGHRDCARRCTGAHWPYFPAERLVAVSTASYDGVVRVKAHNPLSGKPVDHVLIFEA
jgi:hypothetical protein